MHADISLPGVSAEHLVGPEMTSQGQAVQDLKREKIRGLDSFGKQGRMHAPEIPDMRKGSTLRPTTPELHAGKEVKSFDSTVQSSSLGHTTPTDQEQSNHPAIPKRKMAPNHEAILGAGGPRRQLPVDKDNIQSLGSYSSQSARDYDSSKRENQRVENCGSPINLSDVLENNRLGSGIQKGQSSVAQPHVGEELRHLGSTTSQTEKDKTSRLPFSEAEDVRRRIYATPLDQRIRDYFSAVADRQRVKGLLAENANGIRIRGTVTVQDGRYSTANLPAKGGRRYGAVIPGTSGTLSVGSASNRADGQEAPGFIGDDQSAKQNSQTEHDVKKPKALPIPGQTGRNAQTPSKSKAFSPSKCLF